jgi:hypothetical protein
MKKIVPSPHVYQHFVSINEYVNAISVHSSFFCYEKLQMWAYENI